jgi:hypothetical protein
MARQPETVKGINPFLGSQEICELNLISSSDCVYSVLEKTIERSICLCVNTAIKLTEITLYHGKI